MTEFTKSIKSRLVVAQVMFPWRKSQFCLTLTRVLYLSDILGKKRNSTSTKITKAKNYQRKKYQHYTHPCRMYFVGIFSIFILQCNSKSLKQYFQY